MILKNGFNVVMLAGALLAATTACADGDVVAPERDVMVEAAQPAFSAQANEQACWGQASAVFAQMGEMGEHSSSYDTPRLGLRNLARVLYEAGIIEDDTMQALGAFVAAELGLTIEACL